jgi:hypothetical protein
MTDLEVRGFLVTGCKDCPFVEEEIGGYDRSEIMGYFCRLYKREFEQEDQDHRIYGCKNKVPEGFSKFCRLKRIEDEYSKMHQKYKRIVDQINTTKSIIEE